MASAFVAVPGTTERRPRSIPRTAAAATSSGASETKPGTSDSTPSVPAISPNSVGTGPGASTVHETPLPASSAWSASENDWTNAFVAAYVAMPGTGWKAASDATLRIAPARRSTIGPRNARVSSWTAATLSCTIAASMAGSASAVRP